MAATPGSDETPGYKASLERTMLRLRNMIWAILLIAVLVMAGASLRSSIAQKASVPRPQNNLALGEEQVKQLLLLMDTDHDGKVSRQEYMSYMEAEFDRLDRNKSGDLDVSELTRSSLSASHTTYAFTGK